LSIFRKSVEKIQFSLKYGTNNATLHEDQHKYLITSCLVLLIMKNVSSKFVEKIRSQFYLQELSLENRAVYEIMWKIMVKSDRPRIKIWRKHIACWIF